MHWGTGLLTELPDEHKQLSSALFSFCMSQAQQEVRAMQVSEAEVRTGEQVQLCGLTQELRLMRRSSRVTTASHALKAGVPNVPRFRPVHEEVSLIWGAGGGDCALLLP